MTLTDLLTPLTGWHMAAAVIVWTAAAAAAAVVAAWCGVPMN